MLLTSRLVSNARQLLQRKALPVKTIGEATRECHVVAVPPRNRVPKGEMIAMGLILTFSMWAFPFWVFYHIPDYQREDRNQYTGR